MKAFTQLVMSWSLEHEPMIIYMKEFILINLLHSTIIQAQDVCSKKSIVETVGQDTSFGDMSAWILSEGSELYSFSPKTMNSWVTRNNAVGEDAYLVIDLGCSKAINGFYVRNYHYGKRLTYGTKVKIIDF